MLDLGNIFILGDSYSTFEGCIPEGYSAWYTSIPSPETDVTKASQIWWQRLLTQVNGTVIRNDSWSGSTICRTGYDGRDFTFCAFINRLDQYISDGFFAENPVDTILILGGTNDSWSDAPVGTLQYGDWTDASLHSVLPAVGYLTHRLASRFPDKRLLFIINSELKPEIEAGIRTACGHFGIPSLLLKNVDKLSGHPTIAGMEQICRQVLQYLENNP